MSFRTAVIGGQLRELPSCSIFCFKLVDGFPVQHLSSRQLYSRGAVNVSFRTAVIGGQLRELPSCSILLLIDGRESFPRSTLH